MFRLCLAGVLALVFVSACGGSGGGDGGGTPPPAPTQSPPSGLSYTSAVYMMTGLAGPTLSPTITGTVTSYSVNPSLPAGLTLNPTTGMISGTPTAAAPSTTYVVTATNAGGSTSFNLTLTVHPALQGVFMDSVVSGLTWTSGNVSGLTDSNGRFYYVPGQPVEFRVGAIVLGAGMGKPIITPLDFASNGNVQTLQVQNLVRFLMLLDSDGNPANGITISEALRARAANWPSQVNFSVADLATELATVILDTQVDGTLRSLPTVLQAQTHLSESFRCMFSGYFRGTYTGDDNGRFAFTIAPRTGGMAGAAYSVPDDELLQLIFNPQQLPVQNGSAFAAGLAVGQQQTGSSFAGTFPTYDTASGTWTGGTFTGTRYAGTPTAAYKILTILQVSNPSPPPAPPVTSIGSFFTEIDTAGVITAEAHVDFETGEQVFDLAVTQNGNTLTIRDTLTNVSITGTLDLSVPAITGTFTNNQTGNSGTLNSTGCRLR